MDYLSFFRAHPRILTFGFLLTFFSSFGQTFFISLFGGELRHEFELSHGGFGLFYSLATLASGTVLIWAGHLIDHVRLTVFAVVVCLALAASCAFFSTVAHPATLALALFLMRVTGQGLISHTGLTTVSRYIDVGRGKALSLAATGFPAGEALFPGLGVLVMGEIGWRATWLASAVVVVAVLLPVAILLLRGHEERHRTFMARMTESSATPLARQWTRGEVLRDPTFYLVLPALVATPFILTGLIFHQVHLVEQKGWDLTWFASCFVGFALAHLIGSLGSGPLVDRVGATRVAPLFLVPLALGLMTLASSGAALTAPVYLALAGLSAGAGATTSGALWPELYGVTHLGAIRALTSSVMVYSTAASPFTMGWLIDGGVSMNAIAWGCFAFAAGASLLAAVAFRRRAAVAA